MKAISLISLMLFAMPFCAGAMPVGGAESEFLDGSARYQAGDYKGAIEKYLAVEASGYASGELYTNLGSAHYRLAEYGKAILYYEKARLYLSQDADLKTNLELARLKTKDKIAEVPKFFLAVVLENYLSLFSADVLALLTLLLFCLLCAAVIAGLQGLLSPTVSSAAQITGIVLFSLSLLTFIVKSYTDATHVEAVVLTPAVNAKAEPKESATTRFIIHEGLKVELVQEAVSEGEAWLEVRLPDGNTGWIRRADAGFI